MQISLVGKRKLQAQATNVWQLNPQNGLSIALMGIGMDERQIAKFVIVLQPLWAELLATQIVATLNQADMAAVENLASQENLTPEEKEQMIVEMYQIKSGKSVTDFMLEMFADMGERITKAAEDFKQIMSQLESVPEAELEQKGGELIGARLAAYLPMDK